MHSPYFGDSTSPYDVFEGMKRDEIVEWAAVSMADAVRKLKPGEQIGIRRNADDAEALFTLEYSGPDRVDE